MELVILIVVLALSEYILFALQVAKARVKYNVKAPAVTGNPVFERHLRVQQNTIEQLIVFIPAIFSFAYIAESLGWAGNEIAAILGVIFLIGRAIYARSYVTDPASRTLGFVLSFFPSVVLLAGTVVGILVSIM
ncbi:MAG: MAPEG family protein [Pseudomonadota bacterium]